IPVHCHIENYAGWPEYMMRISMIDKDTSYIKVEIKRDAFGNPSVKLKLVNHTEAIEDMKGVGANVMVVKDPEGISSPNIIHFPSERTELKSGTGFLVSRG